MCHALDTQATAVLFLPASYHSCEMLRILIILQEGISGM